jgi:hypothetical protein
MTSSKFHSGDSSGDLASGSAVPILFEALHVQELVERSFDNGWKLVAGDRVLLFLDQRVTRELWEMRLIYRGVHPVVILAVVLVLPGLARDQELDESADRRLRLPPGEVEQYPATSILLRQFDRSPRLDRGRPVGFADSAVSCSSADVVSRRCGR